MEDLIKYLTENKISFEPVDDSYIKIDGKTYFFVEPDGDGLLFSEDFILMAVSEECDRYVYSFGERWYWEEKADFEHPKLNELKYIGQPPMDISTPSFLGVRGAYEILNGSRGYEDWCKKAKFLKCETLGICEKNTLAGVLKFQLACQNNKIKPVIGATYTVLREKEDFRYDLKFYVKNEIGWGNLLMLNKEVNVINRKFVTEDRMLELLEGLFVVVDPKSLYFKDLSLKLKKSIDFYQLDTVVYTNEERDQQYLESLKKYVRSNMKPVSITDAFYLDPEHSHIKKTLNSISGNREFESDNQYFKDKNDYYDELESLFFIFNLATSFEKTIAEECNFSVTIGQRFLPAYEMTAKEKKSFETNEDLFWFLISEGLTRKLKGGSAVYLERIETEFNVIEKGNVIDYFLILWDIISYARRNNILVGIGRGSAGGSLIAYLLDIIQLNPIQFDLLFERFLNEGRIVKSLPDIDTDFPGTKRDMIKKYMEFRYGENQVCSVGTYTALQVKASIKDLSKQYGIDFGEVNQVTTLLPNMKSMNDLFLFCADKRNKRVKAFIRDNVRLVNDVRLVLHQPKAKSVHACAMLILPKEKDMFHWLPICNLDGQMVSEWEGIELETAGFLKEDILGIKQLDKFENIIALIKEDKGVDIDIYSIPQDDRRVYDYFSKGWNEDTFHFGSVGLTGYCKELKPDNIEDLIAGISLYRPGAMENNFHNEYILRKTGKKEVEYITGGEPIMNTTYGVFCYQEQIMKLCQVLGGLSLVEADDVRKAMVKKKYSELTKYKDRFIPNYVKEFGVTQKYSEDVWDSIDKASTYLFNRSHAAAYAITGYISQWFKVNYPVEYWSTAFKFAEEKDYANYIAEIDRTGNIKVMPADINMSRNDVHTDFRTKTIYWPLISIKQCGEVATQQIMDVRDKDGQYFSFEEFLSRNTFKGGKVGKAVVENLILSGAFDELEKINLFTDRLNLIKNYHKINKIKVDPAKDLFLINKENVREDWWWILQQKRLSGIAFFDYKDLVSRYLESDYDIIDIEDFQLPGFQRRKVCIGGYVTEVEEKTSKKKGKWCRVKLESNYTFVTVTMWPEQYKQIESLNLTGKLKTLMMISGQISWDNYKNENVLQTTEDTEIILLE